ADFPPPDRLDSLPTVSFVIPNLANDMHFGAVAAGDAWLSAHLGPYAEWARDHNSLLVVTFDEDDTPGSNHIATIFFGPMVRAGRDDRPITHYSVLRTLEEAYNLAPTGHAGEVDPIDQVWTREAPTPPETPPPPPDAGGTDSSPRRGCGLLGVEALLARVALAARPRRRFARSP